jgi:hypothetical protein
MLTHGGALSGAGGNNISHNLLFQTCGESGDHGAINTWDR